MQTVIKDLPLNEEMDSNDMAAIEGGITTNVALAHPTSFKLPTFGSSNGLKTPGAGQGDGSSGSGDYGGDGGGLGDGGDYSED